MFYLYYTNDTSFRSIGHHNGKLFKFSTFFGHFWSFWGSKWPPGGSEGEVEKIFWQKDVIYLDNSNDTSFSSIRHPNIKLFNFSTFFGHFWGQKSAPEPNESTNKIWK